MPATSCSRRSRRGLATVLRDSDTIGRLGGDEFVVLVEGAGLDAGPEFVAERAPRRAARAVRDRGITTTPITVTASIGIAVGDRDSAGELLRDADIALYEAKTDGKNRFVVFASEMRDAVTDRMKLELDLRGALERDEFFLVYQPIFDLSGGRVHRRRGAAPMEPSRCAGSCSPTRSSRCSRRPGTSSRSAVGC